ncbi:MAG: phospholipase D-like domain-containing protein [Ruaniaceae bacterium]|nr:phospholipase D-like domain-containing protein [Ruaniaceae bacterium]
MGERVKRLRKGLLIAAGALVATQFAAAIGVTVADAVRKRREPLPGKFPRHVPIDVEAHGSELRLYTDGDTLYHDMLADIRSARSTIYFESYIWKDDLIGQEFKRELTAAAHRGVDVYVIYDRFANLVVPPPFKRFDPALRVLPFRLFNGRFLLAPRAWARDHRKILVVDESAGYVGGYNIGKSYADTWRDTHMRVEGPSLAELTNAFVDFWNYYKPKHQPRLPDPGAREWDANVTAVANLPHRLLFPVRGLYLDAIDRATRNIFITQAYFLPDEDMTTALLEAVERGVEVRILVPKLSNHVLADWVSRGSYDQLLAGGVHIHRYMDAMVHSKTMTVDGHWSTVGTTNVDRLSFTGNFEINLAIFDTGFAAAMEDVFANDLSNTDEVELERWRQRSRSRQIIERLLEPFSFVL